MLQYGNRQWKLHLLLTEKTNRCLKYKLQLVCVHVCVCVDMAWQGLSACAEYLSQSTDLHVCLYLFTNLILKSEGDMSCLIIVDSKKRSPKLQMHILNIISMQLKQRRIDYKGWHKVKINSHQDGTVTKQRYEWQLLIA